ncbi:universal stress protein [Aeromicrobium sp.]|uniref:universal stress protein n=1 Tax=Aeromicrobium sp. TaxID=1871063 RepID=UPI0019B477D4|nr:universal stress protein [Aeromicrobium sp.]MBC7633593.1 universal stress protein [Aeromicrobium sp.]
MHMPTIVVGVDGEPASHSALRVALDEATLRHGRVLAVACWSPGENHLPWRPDGRDSDTREKAEQLIREALEAVAADSQERAMIVRETCEDEPGPALVRTSHGADFLVIGSTTRSQLTRHVGKATVDHCLRFSDVPVIVVPCAPSGFEGVDLESELRQNSDDKPADISL